MAIQLGCVGGLWRIRWDPTPFKRPDDTKGFGTSGAPVVPSPLFGAWGDLAPWTFAVGTSSLGQLGVGKMPCTASRRLGRSRAGLPGRRARALALVPQHAYCVAVCGSRVSWLAEHQIIACFSFCIFHEPSGPMFDIKDLGNITHAHAVDVQSCIHIWSRCTLIDCPQTVCRETPNVPHDPEGRWNLCLLHVYFMCLI